MAAETDSRGVPLRECDVVMRGGVTSGVVYPGALRALSERFRFRSIGGTSAGAIAAAVLAAVEYGRRSGRNPRSGDILARIGEDLAGSAEDPKSGLQRLFQPSKALAFVFKLFLGLLAENSTDAQKNRTWSLAAKIVFASLLRYWWIALGAAIAAALLLWVAIAGSTTVWTVIVASIAVLATLSVAAVGLALWLLSKELIAQVPAHNFGLCSGLTGDTALARRLYDSNAVPSFPPPAGLALTDWMHWTIQAAAGLPLNEPLTFRHLQSADEGTEAARRPDYRAIDLALMTTNLSHGIQHCFPSLERGKFEFYFKRKDLKRILPAPVVKWMLDRARSPAATGRATLKARVKGKSDGTEIPASGRADTFRRLPIAADLPVLLGARMSLSFPLLLEQVPLYELDVVRAQRRQLAGKEVDHSCMRRLWFSDGGLTSNFPIHIFDGPIPSRPTFGINLIYGNPTNFLEEQDALDEEADPLFARAGVPPASDGTVHMATFNSSGQVPSFRPLFERKDSAMTRLRNFLGVLMDTARNWGDTELMTQPGYRDRVAHVQLQDGEGGFNLRMKKETVDQLNQRGMRAGAALADRFAPAEGRPYLGWENHCWVRYRSTMASLEKMAAQFLENWNETASKAGLRTEDRETSLYNSLLAERTHGDERPYAWATAIQEHYGEQGTKRLLALLDGFIDETRRAAQADAESLPAIDLTYDREQPDGGAAPSPRPKLRMMPDPRR